MALSAITARDKGFEESVRMHFTRGVAALASLASCLLQAQEDSSAYAGVRQHIEEALQEFSRAEGLAQQKLERVDAATLELTVRKKTLTDEQKALQEILSTVQTHLKTLKELQRENMANCQQKRLEKESAQAEQMFAEAEAEKERHTRNAALWSMLIPVVGTVIGGIVAIGAHRAMKDAEESAAMAEEVVDECTKREQEYRKEMEKYAKQIDEREESILQNQRRINAIAEEKDMLAKLHKEVLDLQEALRHCSHFVGTLVSQASAAEITSRYVCIYNSLREQLSDMSNQMLPLLGVDSLGAEGMVILSSPTIERSIRKLKHFSGPPNIFRNIYYDVMDHLLCEGSFSWHFILYVTVFLFLAVFFSGSLLFCLAERLLPQLVLPDPAVFFSAIRLSWFFLICFILLCIFHYFIKNSQLKGQKKKML